MPLIERYIMNRVLVATMMALVVTTAMVLVTQLLNRVNLMMQTGQSLFIFVRMAIAMAPQLAMLVLPFTLLIGILRTLNTMNSDSELAVLEAAGRSPMGVARPIVLLALALSLVSLASAQYAEPYFNRQLRDLINAASADLLRSAIQSGTFTRLDANTYVQISEELPGGEFGGFMLVDLRDPQTQLIYFAKRGSLLKQDGKTTLLLADGEVHRKNKQTGEVSIITFTRTALDFSEFAPQSGQFPYLPREYYTETLISPPPGDLFRTHFPGKLREELNRRFSDWLYPLVFGLVAVYFAGGAQSHRQERLAQITIATTIALTLRILSFVTVNGSGLSTLLAALTFGIPIGAILIFSVGILTGVTLRPPRWLVERTGSLIALSVRPYVALWRRLSALGERL